MPATCIIFVKKTVKATKTNNKLSVLLMKLFLIIILTAIYLPAKSQVVDSIFFNLYTDSLKKGSWNYISVDAKLSNGKYIPLSNQQLIITTTAGKLEGNSVWLNWDFNAEHITVQVQLKENPSIKQQKTIWVKKHDLQLEAPVKDSLLQQLNNRNKKTNSGKRKKN
jgi:hypothetical protein